jgi:hypothetical protein
LGEGDLIKFLQLLWENETCNFSKANEPKFLRKCGCPRNTYGWLKTWFLKTNVPKFSKKTWFVEELEMLHLKIRAHLFWIIMFPKELGSFASSTLP